MDIIYTYMIHEPRRVWAHIDGIEFSVCQRCFSRSIDTDLSLLGLHDWRRWHHSLTPPHWDFLRCFKKYK